jgi:hypothetical protein
MLKAAVPAAILLVIVLETQHWPRVHVRAVQIVHLQPLSTNAARACGRRVINDWVRDGQIDTTYRKECYEAVLKIIPETEHYGISPRDAAEEWLRTSAKSGTSAGG